MENPSLAFSFLRFHLNVGARLAVKILAPLIAVFFAVLYIFKVDFFVVLARALFVDSHFVVSGLIYSAITIGASRMISPRICTGLNGWIRHLPLKSRSNRRMALISIFMAQVPVLLSLSLPSLLLSNSLGVNPAVYLSGLPMLGLSSAFFVLPIRNSLFIKPFVLFACILSASGNWIMLIAGVLLFLICDLVSGPLVTGKKRQLFGRVTRGTWLNYFIAWRALRWRIGFPYIFSFIILGLTQVFIQNNDHSPVLIGKIYLFGGICSAVVICAFLAHVLAVRRPPWPWSRSLPWSSRRRVLIDAGFLALSVIPLVLLVFVMERKTIFPILLSLPTLCFLSSWTMGRAFDLRTGAYGTILILGGIGALLLCLYPLISIVYLILAPVLFKQAVEQERLLKVSRWLERHHLAAGDSLSWNQK